jgi:hypothetical protein
MQKTVETSLQVVDESLRRLGRSVIALDLEVLTESEAAELYRAYDDLRDVALAGMMVVSPAIEGAARRR